MVYFLGRDVSVALATENSTIGVTAAADALTISAAASGTAAALGSGSSTFPDVTGVDLSIGAMDEDISYYGMRSQTKAEIKKETVLTITKKKTNDEWDTVFNKARFGVSGASQEWYGLEEPTITHGYRIYVQLKSSSEVFTVPNACVQSHTTTINADGVQEETIEFMSYVTPRIGSANYTTATSGAAL
jgi:hypothetical protein